MKENSKKAEIKRWTREDLPTDPYERFQLLREDFWAFLCTCVFTSDEKDEENPIKPAPVEKDYLWYLTQEIENNQLINIVKSRQMWLSWFCDAYVLWSMLNNVERKGYVVHKNFQDADQILLGRIEKIYNRIPTDIWPGAALPSMHKKEGFIIFKDIGCQIQGLPSGKEAFRGHVGSVVLNDEFGSWPLAQETVGIQIPAARKIICVSNIPEQFGPEEPYLKKLTYDKDVGQRSKVHFEEKEYPGKHDIVQGLNRWTNKINGFRTIMLHFSADPEKNTPEWIAKSKIGLTIDEWRREVNLEWTQSAGQPVYGEEFNYRMHVMEEQKEPVAGYPIIRAWDFGFNQCCLVGQVIGQTLYVLEEILAEDYFKGETNVGTVRFAPFVRDHCKKYYKGFDFVDVIDPQGFVKDDSEERACADAMYEYAGISPIPGPKWFEIRRNAMLELLIQNSGGKPRIQINPEETRTFIGGFEGGYCYPDSRSRNQSQRVNRPVKNRYSHIHDCGQYMAWYVLQELEDEENFEEIDYDEMEFEYDL